MKDFVLSLLIVQAFILTCNLRAHIVDGHRL